ncbi:hypothetical protein DPMN_127787 [Dreissena polymorpha]|uniref:Uncharacterized protein n=1 Tax=Dreissena polymorpha TaxID=45954 RepID=A0A9D4H5X3_DREPO|nr:hypothetical protein DPMN_127787 [Dreissena polymorpha]
MRKIVVKFTFLRKEIVLKLWRELDGTVNRVFEQFPRVVIEKRRNLVPQMKDTGRLAKRAYPAYDPFYINGTADRA